MADIKKLLGAKISKIRKDKGFSQIKFAEMLGISTNALSIIETGNGFLTAETLEKILDKLNLEPDELFTFGGAKSEDQIYDDIIRLLSVARADRNKLSTIYNFIKNII
ncbi:helix-turn-helix transcriptional regulator [bacterium]|nr:helix-turn-helix transcriptional regulator [bacterium]